MKLKDISVNLPINYSETEAHLFLNSLSYRLTPLRSKVIKNAFVTYTGFCMSNDGLVKESHHDYPEQYHHYLSSAYFYFYEAKNDPNKIIDLYDSNFYLLIHHPWFNYYHWMTEVIPRIWITKGEVSNMILLLPDHFQKIRFVMESLAPFTFKDIYFIPKDKSLFVKNLYLPQIKPICAHHDSNVTNRLRQTYLEYVLNKKCINENLGDRLYISRQRASCRKVSNEDQVLELVKKHGFQCIICENYSFFEQVAIFNNAKFLVSIHGAGLTNMLFMKKNSSVMELHKRITNNTDHYSLTLWYLADSLEHKYYQQICDPTDINENYYTANLDVDITELENNLKLMLKDISQSS